MWKVYLKIWIVVLLFASAFGLLFCQPLPDVHWSTSQDKCVKVIAEDTKYSCENLPSKYNPRIWVE